MLWASGLAAWIIHAYASLCVDTGLLLTKDDKRTYKKKWIDNMEVDEQCRRRPSANARMSIRTRSQKTDWLTAQKESDLVVFWYISPVTECRLRCRRQQWRIQGGGGNPAMPLPHPVRQSGHKL